MFMILPCYSKFLVSKENMSWSEESFVVEMSLEEGLLLAEKYEQNAIYWVMNQHVFLVYCADKIPILIGKWPDFITLE